MEKYRIEIKRSVIKEFEKIHPNDLKKILTRIGNLANEPRPMDCKKLSSEEKYRIRYRMYRILYAIDDVLIVLVVKVGYRKGIY